MDQPASPPSPQGGAPEAMNAAFRRIIAGLRLNAERDVLLARADGDPHAQARAQARMDTLDAALEIYAASHRLAYGRRPWPRPEATDRGRP